MKIIDGKIAAQTVYKNLSREIEILKKKRVSPPHLNVILVGNDPASHTYVQLKKKKCRELNIDCTINFFENIDSENLKREIQKANASSAIDGIIVQLPIKGIHNQQEILDSISPKKDVDGFCSTNYGKMAVGENPYHIPATPLGILMLLRYYKIETQGKHCVVLGRGKTVGSPLSVLLSLKRPFANSTVTLCHSKTENLKAITQHADILISATANPQFIDSSFIKENAVVIDVGINKILDSSCEKGYRIVGDVDFASVSKKASWVSPVPGGVGPMTIAALLKNTVRAACYNI